MHSEATDIESALADFSRLIGWQPYGLSGAWWIAKTKDGFTAYRTKKAASRNATTGIIWKLESQKGE